MSESGGFQGRTHKLVDGCYSYWVGGLFPLINDIIARRATDKKEEEKEEGREKKKKEKEERDEGKRMWPLPVVPGGLLYSCEDLQKYILVCCQDPVSVSPVSLSLLLLLTSSSQLFGGLRDKPGVS